MRPETGPMKFEGDWTGYFIRGDNAHGYAAGLYRILQNAAAKEGFELEDRLLLQGLMDDLRSTDERGQLRGLQEMHAFDECVLKK